MFIPGGTEAEVGGIGDLEKEQKERDRKTGEGRTTGGGGFR